MLRTLLAPSPPVEGDGDGDMAAGRSEGALSPPVEGDGDGDMAAGRPEGALGSPPAAPNGSLISGASNNKGSCALPALCAACLHADDTCTLGERTAAAASTLPSACMPCAQAAVHVILATDSQQCRTRAWCIMRGT